MILLFDKNKKLLDEFSPNELLLAEDELKLNGQWVANISYPFVYHNKKNDYFGYFYNENFYMYKIIQVKNDNGKIYLKGIHIFFDEMRGLIVRDKKPSNKTVQQVCDDTFNDSDWEFISSVTNNITSSFYHISYLEAFYKIVENSNAEFYLEIKLSGGNISKKRVILKNNISKNYGKWFEYGSNLVSVVAEENHSNVFTAFIGRGKGEENGDGGFGRKIKFDSILWSKSKGDPVNKPLGQDYIEIEEATKLFGYENNKPKITVVDFDDIEDKEKLLLETYNYALKNSRPKLLLSAKAHSNERIDIGEIVTIIRDDLDIRYQTKVISLRRNLLNDTKEFEIGENVTKSQVQRLKENEIKQENQINTIVSILDDALDKITKDYFAEDAYTYNLKTNNEYNLPSGIYSFNKPISENPTKVVYIGAGKVLIATSKTTDGNWDWKTAIDGTGIYGEQIVAGSITSNKLSADVGQSLDLSSNESVRIKVAGEVKSYVDKNKALLKGDKGDTGEKGEAGQDAEIDYNYLMQNSLLIESETEPTDTSKLWLDSSTTPAKLKIYDGAKWIDIDYELKKQMTEFIALQNGYNMNFITNLEFGDFQNNINQNFNTIEKYIRFVDGKIILGQKENPFTLQISKDRISFFEGDNNELAYFSNQNLYVENLEILKKLTVASAEIRMITDNVAGIGVIGR